MQIKWALGELSPESRSIDGRRYIQMALDMQDNHGLIRLPQGKPVGLLNRNAFQALLDCSRLESFHTDILILQDQWDDKMNQLEGGGAASHRRNGIVIIAELVLFGLKTFGDKLAESLGIHQLFLQPPHDGFSWCPYHNPQSLSLPDIHAYMEVDTADLGLRAALASRGVSDMDEASERSKRPDLRT